MFGEYQHTLGQTEYTYDRLVAVQSSYNLAD